MSVSSREHSCCECVVLPPWILTWPCVSTAQGNQSRTVRGCATASWCHGSHAADAFLLSRLNVSCCEGSGCNLPTGASGVSSPTRLSLGACLLAVTLTLGA